MNFSEPFFDDRFDCWGRDTWPDPVEWENGFRALWRASDLVPAFVEHDRRNGHMELGPQRIFDGDELEQAA